MIDEARGAAAALDFGDPEASRVPSGPKSDDLLTRNVTSFLDLFTPRQLLYLGTATELFRELPEEHRLWLALLVSTSLDFNSPL